MNGSRALVAIQVVADRFKARGWAGYSPLLALKITKGWPLNVRVNVEESGIVIVPTVPLVSSGLIVWKATRL